MERISTEALATLGGDYKGEYHSLEKMTEKEQQKLIDEHLLFDKPVSPLLNSSRMARDWPDARGQSRLLPVDYIKRLVNPLTNRQLGEYICQLYYLDDRISEADARW